MMGIKITESDDLNDLREFKLYCIKLISVITRMNLLLGEAALVKFSNSLFSSDKQSDPAGVLHESNDVLAVAERIKILLKNVFSFTEQIQNPPNIKEVEDLKNLLENVRSIIPAISSWKLNAVILLENEGLLKKAEAWNKFKEIENISWLSVCGINSRLNNLGLIQNEEHPNAPVLPLPEK